MDDVVYKNIAEAIIRKQADIIGKDIAMRKARKVTNIILDDVGKIVRLGDDPVKCISDLIQEYANLSADAALRFSREAALPFITPTLKIPDELKPSYQLK